MAVSAEMSGTEASLKNFAASVIGQAVIIVTNFSCRRIFLSLLGSEYLGLSGLFGHLLSLLSLLEPGFLAAIIYAYYKPIASGDISKMSALNSYLSRINLAAGIVTAVVGFLLTPYLGFFTDMPNGMENLTTYYLLSVANLAFSYIFASRRALAFSDRRGYIPAIFHTVSFVVMSFGRLWVLYLTKSYIAYLVSSLIFGVAEDFILHVYLGAKYPLLRDRSHTLSQSDRRMIHRQVEVLFFHRLGGIIVGSIDNLTVMSLMGLSAGATYSNYTMISGAFSSFIGIIAGSISSSLGNVCAVSGRKRMRGIFVKALLLALVSAAIATPTLFYLYPRIISSWVGEEYLLDNGTTVLFCLCFCVSSLRSVFLVFRDAMGLFRYEFAKPFLEVAVNLSFTLSLAPHYGISGVLIGQLMGMLVCLIYEPCVVILGLYGRKSEIKSEMLSKRSSASTSP